MGRLQGCRAAVLLLAVSLAACAQVPAAPQAVPAECNAAPDPAQPQYIVGYGSLMQDESRKRTSPQAGPAHPVDVKGYRRGWFARPDAVGFSATFLGAVKDPQGRFNAVIYRVDGAELRATDQRERSYCRALVAPADLATLDREFPKPDGQAWIYVNRTIARADSSYPIVQSYVDIFVTGCLEQEERFGLAGFARRCLATTTDWSGHWVNDRLYPRRPFIYQPKARQIDTLLSTELPGYFSRIRIEPGG